MDITPTGQALPYPANSDPVALLNLMINLQSQTIELQRQTLEAQRQQLELIKETTQAAREQRARQVADLERWQTSHSDVLDVCKDSLGKLEQVHASLLRDLADYIAEYHENLVDGDFALSEFVDRFGPRLAHLNTMLAVLRPLAAAQKKPNT
ncbi:hypothetical protein TsocGM_23245 [Tautonia sociabilis]|uniref:Uncharacterized protein n=2 Tax=Tautonia sociabilis TaxID=2080755 RepID=A0A432MDH3_9BACT|nr:hypothetical protein TsocGM_23245 [Tautonia sociabilis]